MERAVTQPPQLGVTQGHWFRPRETASHTFVGQSNRPTQVDFPNGMQTLYDYFGATGDLLLKQIKNLSAGPTPTVISQSITPTARFVAACVVA